MPNNVRIYRVFCASPGDVTKEREILKKIIEKMNRINFKDKNYRLEFVGWEEDVVSQFGVDPQTAINEQIGDKYDIFVMILWKRIGSGTPRAISGTVEEFARAANRWFTAGYPKIGIYLRDEKIDHWREPLEQVSAVVRLFEKLKKHAFMVLYKPPEFEEKMMKFLLAQVEELTTPKED